jgi:hypothetical protein
MAAQFKKPPSAPLGQYDVQPGSISVWRIRIHEGQHGRIALFGAPSARVRSNNPIVVPNDDSVFSVVDQRGLRLVDFYGLSSGTSIIEARDVDNEVVAYVQVQVVSLDGKHAFFDLAEPNMALNAADSPVRYRMKHTEKIGGGVDPSQIIDKVAATQELKHLAFSCHGYANPKEGPYLAMGAGFTDNNVDLFDRLHSVMSGVIWMAACSICQSQNGVAYCKQIAQRAGCYVVAPAITLPPVQTGINQIEVFTRSLPHYFDPSGALMKASEFMKLGRKLGFRLSRVQ